MSKRVKKVTLALADEDLDAVEACRKLAATFPPSRAELLAVCARDTLCRLLQGTARLKDVYDLHGASPFALARAVKERLDGRTRFKTCTDGQNLFINCNNCGAGAVFNFVCRTPHAETLRQIEVDKWQREHVCEVADGQSFQAA